MRKRLSFVLFFILLLASCHRKERVVTRGFYYWRTVYSLTNYERQRLYDLHSGALYLHCFDVDWDEAKHKPKPLAVLRFDALPDTLFSYTPVIFITQKTVLNISPQQVPELAADIAHLVSRIVDDNRLSVKEIQIDCDWTRSSRDAYFALLAALRNQPIFLNMKLSCTIRLHQIKYRMSSGIPPVDNGLLMCYNLGNLKLPGAHNSILDAGLLKDYLKTVNTYPLKLNIALPLFQWCLQFRNGRMRGILRDITPESIAGSSIFTPSKANLYRCEDDTVWLGYDFRKGDEIRIENPSLNTINEAAAYTSKALKNDSLTVLFFHADSLTLSHYSNDELETIYHHYY